VDLTEHSFGFNCPLPCEGDAFEFKAEVHITYAVSDPATIVERNVTDVRAILEPLIIHKMRSISREYDVEESAAAELAINQAIADESHDIGVKLNRSIIRLSLDEDARAHIRKLRQIERDKEHERRAAELERQRDELELVRIGMKVDFYSPLIRKCLWELLALQLTKRPEDLETVAQMLIQQRQAELDRQLNTLRIMLEDDALEGFQMEEASKIVLQRFVESLGPELETSALEEAGERMALPTGKEDGLVGRPETSEAEPDETEE
jgi:hypothetical protein